MDKRVKKLWLKALRGRKFKQGKGQLRRGRIDPRYCCLGVLEELAVCEGVIKSFRGNNAGLTDKVTKWAGLKDQMPKAGKMSLTRMNDTGKSFKQIADRIEKYL